MSVPLPRQRYSKRDNSKQPDVTTSKQTQAELLQAQAGEQDADMSSRHLCEDGQSVASNATM